MWATHTNTHSFAYFILSHVWVSVQRCSFIRMYKYFRELCTGFLCLLKWDVIYFSACTKFPVSRTDKMYFLPFLEWKLRLLFWTLVKQNKSAIPSKTNHLFYWPVLFFFSCPWEKWCWRSLWGSDHGTGGEKGSANHAHPSPLPAVPLNAAISRTGQINQDSLPSALNCTSSLNCTHTDTHTSTLMPPISEMLQLVDDKVSLLAMSVSQLSLSLRQSQGSGVLHLKLNLACFQRLSDAAPGVNASVFTATGGVFLHTGECGFQVQPRNNEV